MDWIVVNEKMIKDFVNYLVEEERSEATIEKYERDVRHFVQFLGSDLSITREKVINFKKALLKEYQVTSANSMLVALNQFLQYIGCPYFKVKRIKIQKKTFREEETELSENEYKKMVKYALEKGKDRLALILETICSTGIRVSELKYFTIRCLNIGKVEIYNKGKVRTILLPEKLRKKLLYYTKKKGIISGAIFVTSTGNPVDRSNLWREMKKLGIKVEIVQQKIYPHNLRHLFARAYYRVHRDLIGLSDILGHSSINTTRIYTMTTGYEYRRKLNKLQLIS